MPIDSNRRPPPAQEIPTHGPVLFGGAVIAASVVIAYRGTFLVPFLFDDESSVVRNASIRRLGAAFLPPLNATVTGRPVLNLSLAVNYALGGTSLWGYHATNLAIHVLAALALFGIIRRTVAGRGCRRATAAAFSAALLWSVHPLLTGAVTYVAQRAESLMGLFYLTTLYCFIRGAGSRAGGSFPWFALSVASCLLGMATKEVMATAPLIVLLYDRTFVACSFGEALRRRWKVHGALAATWALLAFLVISTLRRGDGSGSSSGSSWWGYGLSQIPAVAHYLRLCFWPFPLVFDYGTALAAPSIDLLPGALLVVGLAAATCWALVRRPVIGFVGAGFFVILAPSSSIVPVAGETVADYRMYLPLIPVVIIAVGGVYRWTGRAALPVCLVLGIALGGVTARRNRDYSSAREIWGDTVAKRPGNFRARNNLAGILLTEPGRLDDAISQYEEVVHMKPDSAEAHVNLGNALSDEPGRLDDAVAQYGEALRLDPGLYGAHIGLGNALSNMPGRLMGAVAEYGEALRLDPDSAEGHFNLGNALSRVPQSLDDAVFHYREALRLRPGFAEAHFSLAVVYLKMGGHVNEARAQLQEGLRLQPGDAQARRILADVSTGIAP
jgi:Flp pilus assembly protein TadD